VVGTVVPLTVLVASFLDRAQVKAAALAVLAGAWHSGLPHTHHRAVPA
jgi:hypothetical protein